MKVVYARISTPDQKHARQLQTEYDEAFIDIRSGSIPFMERPEAQRLIRTEGVKQVTIKEVSRLGRNLRDILDTLEYFTNKEIDIYIENQGLHTLVNGKKNKTAELIISILGTIAQQERELLLERTKEGVAIAKAQGKYKGRKRGANMSIEKYQKRYSDLIPRVNELRKKGISISVIARTLNINRTTLTKLSNLGLIS
jgi:DNA invertase Pin-like site-specific DNA recombinase|tara:strand:+ start:2303 stop:2896 length:594 start_codon:yes stop_codon:yes gene_type:complete